jgi:Protein of unknown function (DUF3634)
MSYMGTRGKLAPRGTVGVAKVSLALVAVVGLVVVWFLTRSGELFCLSIRRGKLIVVRGRVPVGFVAEASAVVRRARVQSGTIRAVKTEHGGRLHLSGLDERTEQVLRNLFALYPASQLRHAPAIPEPTLGQLVGVAWLAWLLDRSSRA